MRAEEEEDDLSYETHNELSSRTSLNGHVWIEGIGLTWVGP
jgi:hypothetical protein